MGKKSKKTRWRTLTLNGHQSDSEESSSKSSLQTSKGYQHKYSKFPYSSQSTPIRKFQHESSKSTRSNSTTSEHKATFNEDEYTRITTPRQDVLFKKGYLNKPKTYQTQTSTGTSSTANSTSTCTPDHQSADGTEGTDLEYESQFVFPNGFIDQNGIYYINSFEPFPFVVYNAPICYPEYPNSRSKRYSTDSLTESVSPHNEEVGQELTQNGAGERINNTPVFSHTYMQPAGYYYNGVSTVTNGQYPSEEARRLKKRRRRKVSRSKSNHEEGTSEDTDDYSSSDEVFSQSETNIEHKKSLRSPSINHSQLNGHAILSKHEEGRQSESPVQKEILEQTSRLTNGESENRLEHVEGPPQAQTLYNNTIEPPCEDESEERLKSLDEEDPNAKSNLNDAQNLLLQSLLKNSLETTNDEEESLNPTSISDSPNEPQDCTQQEAPSLNENSVSSYSLKPDAEEFIPRTFRAPEALPFDPNVQFLNIPPNFIPIPFVNHLGELQRPPFLPPGIPLNFVPPQDPKMLPNFLNVVPNGNFPPKTFDAYSEAQVQDVSVSSKPSEPPEETSSVVIHEEKSKEPEVSTQTDPEPVQAKKLTRNEIDIAKIVSKLEEAAKEQRVYETKRQGYPNRASNKYNTAKPYPAQRTRYAKNYQDAQRYPDSRYQQRNRPNSLEKQYDRKYRKPEPNFQRDRPKRNFERDGSSERAKSEVRLDETVPKVENCLEGDESAKSRQNVERKTNERELLVRQKCPEHTETHESDQNHVNNVNTRIGESCSMIKDLKLEATVNYSETLKKKVDVIQNNTKNSSGNKYVRYEKHEKVDKKSEQKPIETSTTPKPQKAQNQWISVSSRKKRKNKTIIEEQSSVEEQDHEETPTPSDDHLFESFDVNLLEDVVPPSKLIEPSEVIETKPEDPLRLEEKVTTEKEETSKEVDVPEVLEESAKTLLTVEEIQEIEDMLSMEFEDVSMAAPKDNLKSKKKPDGNVNKKKKSKKGTQKPLIKRVIITDLNLELDKPVPKPDLKPKSTTPNCIERNKKEEEQDPKPNVAEDQQSQNNTLEDSQVIQKEEEQSLTIPTDVKVSQNQVEETNRINDVPEEHTSEYNTDISSCEDIKVDEGIKMVVQPVLEGSSSSYQTQTSESDTITETPEKKNKKKKKKTPKPALIKIQSASSSNTTLNNLDDSYDFLIENAILEDVEQKTNVEISQELDRMIQKGMYSSLEEKIRALKISASEDGFFRTINYGMLQEQVASEKSSIIKASNFGKMLRNTTQLLRMPKGLEEIDQQDSINIDFSKIKLPDLEPQPSTSKSGIFLENPEVNELIKSATNNKVDPSFASVAPEPPVGKTKNNGKLKNKSKKNSQAKNVSTKPVSEEQSELQPTEDQKGEQLNGTIHQESKNLSTSKTFSSHEVEPSLRKSPPKQDSLYPITQAVKDWMTRTRENTPDVEILKSPNTIFKEFYETETETESESTGDSKNGLADVEKQLGEATNGDPRSVKTVSRESSPLRNQTKSNKPPGARVIELSHDDEITIWSVSPQNSIDEDLLDCWENELTNGSNDEDTKYPLKKLTNGVHATKVSENVLVQNGEIKEIKGLVQNGCQTHLNGHIEEGEEAIEVYQSQYGKNEDFLKLKAEIEEQQKMNFPKHGNLPYRAICCSIM